MKPFVLVLCEQSMFGRVNVRPTRAQLVRHNQIIAVHHDDAMPLMREPAQRLERYSVVDPTPGAASVMDVHGFDTIEVPET